MFLLHSLDTRVNPVVIVMQLDLQLPMQSVHITTNAVSSYHAQTMSTQYDFMWSNLSATSDWSVHLSGYSSFHHDGPIFLKGVSGYYTLKSNMTYLLS
jgi:hypothetical protein